MQRFSYHTHTTFSDGKNTANEMIEQAERLGLFEIGISDHLIVHKNIAQTKNYPFLQKMTFSNFKDAYERCSKHIEELRRLQKEHQIKIKVGFETDYFIYDGWHDEMSDFLKKIDYDYLINGNHFLMDKTGEYIEDMTYIAKNPNEDINEPIKISIQRHFETMEKAIRSGFFTFLAHMDYVKKISSYHETDFHNEIENVIRALKETNTACELNTKGLRRSNGFYPAQSILEKLIQSDISLLISDDSHQTNEMCFEFESADQYLNNLHAKRFSL